MINLEPNMTARDIYQWLSDGWFYFRKTTTGDYEIGKLGYAEDNELLVHTLDGGRHTIKGRPENYIFPHWPELGSLNLPETKCATHIDRLQARQWCRTFSPRLVRIATPYAWTLSKKRPEMGNISIYSPEVLKAAFKPTYPAGISDLVDRFNDGWVSVALSPRIIVTNTTPRLVYYRGKLALRQHRDGQQDIIDVRAAGRVQKAYPGGIHA